MKDWSKLKEIIVFAPGDSKLLTTWSNVPYFLTSTLEKKGIIVDRVDLNDYYINNFKDRFLYICSRLLRIVFKLFYRSNISYKYDYIRYHDRNLTKAMNDIRNKYPDADGQIIIHLSYCPDNDIPTVMFGDWTVDYKIRNQRNRQPYIIEKDIISRQYEALSRADAIVSLYPNSCKMIKENIKKDNVYYLGHVINSLYPYIEDIDSKYNSNRILFIGRKKAYLNGLIRLIKVVNYYNEHLLDNRKPLLIDVIGINKEDINENINLDNCVFHGYINKDDEKQKEEYYQLLRNSKLMVNITPKWNGPSSLHEALYHGVPIMASNNIEVESMFSKDICCFVEDDETIQEVAEKLSDIMNLDYKTYSKMSKKAHEYGEQCTWDIYVDKLLALMEKIKNEKN